MCLPECTLPERVEWPNERPGRGQRPTGRYGGCQLLVCILIAWEKIYVLIDLASDMLVEHAVRVQA
jgi:hypothetical protein